MYCQKCGTEARDGSAFCMKCGTPLPAKLSPPAKPQKPRRRLRTFVLFAGVFLLLIAAGVGGFAVYHAWKQSQDLAEYYARGSTALQTGDYETALQALRWVVDRSPDYEDARAQLREAQAEADLGSLLSEAQASCDQQEWEAAIELLEELQASEPDYQPDAVTELLAAAYQNSGLDLVESGQYAEAVARFEQSLALAADAEVEKHKTLAALYPDGQVALEGGQYDSAIEALGEVYALDPGYGDVAGELYTAYMAACAELRDSGDLEDAEARCLAAYEVNPVEGEAAVQLTQVAFLRTPTATPTRTPSHRTCELLSCSIRMERVTLKKLPPSGSFANTSGGHARWRPEGVEMAWARRGSGEQRMLRVRRAPATRW